jgi:hypothetical protein
MVSDWAERQTGRRTPTRLDLAGQNRPRHPGVVRPPPEAIARGSGDCPWSAWAGAGDEVRPEGAWARPRRAEGAPLIHKRSIRQLTKPRARKLPSGLGVRVEPPIGMASRCWKGDGRWWVG